MTPKHTLYVFVLLGWSASGWPQSTSLQQALKNEKTLIAYIKANPIRLEQPSEGQALLLACRKMNYREAETTIHKQAKDIMVCLTTHYLSSYLEEGEPALRTLNKWIDKGAHLNELEGWSGFQDALVRRLSHLYTAKSPDHDLIAATQKLILKMWQKGWILFEVRDEHYILDYLPADQPELFAFITGLTQNDPFRRQNLTQQLLRARSYEEVKILLENGANPRAITVNGNTVFHLNREWDARAYDLLLSKFPEPDCQNHKGQTPLMVYLSWGYPEAIHCFMAKDLDWAKTDIKGRSSLYYAVYAFRNYLLGDLLAKQVNWPVTSPWNNPLMIAITTANYFAISKIHAYQPEFRQFCFEPPNQELLLEDGKLNLAYLGFFYYEILEGKPANIDSLKEKFQVLSSNELEVSVLSELVWMLLPTYPQAFLSPCVDVYCNTFGSRNFWAPLKRRVLRGQFQRLTREYAPGIDFPDSVEPSEIRHWQNQIAPFLPEFQDCAEAYYSIGIETLPILDGQSLTVKRVTPGSSAALIGIMPKDRFTQIDHLSWVDNSGVELLPELKRKAFHYERVGQKGKELPVLIIAAGPEPERAVFATTLTANALVELTAAKFLYEDPERYWPYVLEEPK